MNTLIRKATIIAMGGPQGDEPFTGDILVDGDRIAAIGADLGETFEATMIDGRDRLVIPSPGGPDSWLPKSAAS